MSHGTWSSPAPLRPTARLRLGHSTRRGSGRPARTALAQLKTLNTYLDFKIHVLQKFLVHCLCKFVDGSQEHPKKEKQG